MLYRRELGLFNHRFAKLVDIGNGRRGEARRGESEKLLYWWQRFGGGDARVARVVETKRRHSRTVHTGNERWRESEVRPGDCGPRSAGWYPAPYREARECARSKAPALPIETKERSDNRIRFRSRALSRSLSA